jgi:phage-related minor tail protein
MPKRDEYVERMKQQLDELNAHIGELEAKVQAGQEDVGKKAQEQLTHLRELYSGMKARLEEMTDAGEESWDALVAEGDKVWKAFIHSVNYFKSQLK